jgi:hypothetical protein
MGRERGKERGREGGRERGRGERKGEGLFYLGRKSPRFCLSANLADSVSGILELPLMQIC